MNHPIELIKSEAGQIEKSIRNQLVQLQSCLNSLNAFRREYRECSEFLSKQTPADVIPQKASLKAWVVVVGSKCQVVSSINERDATLLEMMREIGMDENTCVVTLKEMKASGSFAMVVICQTRILWVETTL